MRQHTPQPPPRRGEAEFSYPPPAHPEPTDATLPASRKWIGVVKGRTDNVNIVLGYD